METVERAWGLLGSLPFVGDGPRPVALGVLALLVALVSALDTLPIVGLAVPGDVAVVGAVAAAGAGGGPLVVASVTVGAMLGWSAGFGAGHGLRWLRQRSGHDVGLGVTLPGPAWMQRGMVRTEAMLSGRGERILVLAPFLPLVNAIAPFVAGAAGLRYRRVLAFGALGSAAWAALYALVGWAATVGLAGLGTATGTEVPPVLGVVVAVPVSLFAAFLARRALRARPAPVPTA